MKEFPEPMEEYPKPEGENPNAGEENPESEGMFDGLFVSPPRVIVKFKEGSVPPYQSDIEGYDSIGDYIQKNNLGPWAALAEQFPGISINLIFVSVDPETIRSLVRQAQEMDRSYRDPNFLSYFAVEYDKVPDDASYNDLYNNMQIIQKELSAWESVELAYIEHGLGPLPSVPSATNNDELNNQRYLNLPNVGGVGVRFAWDYWNLTYPSDPPPGTGIDFIDIERGWDLDHVDLSDPAMPIPWLGVNKEAKVHGTASLGVVVARDDVTGSVGVVGFAYKANAKVVSVYVTTATTKPDRDNAIMTALSNLKYGDVLLIEEQAVGDAITIGGVACHKLWPLESPVVDPTTGVVSLTWEVIYLGTTLGIIIVEPAGNGPTPDLITASVPGGTPGHDLSDFTDPSGKYVLKPPTATVPNPDFKDSRAIIVGSASRGEVSEAYTHRRTVQKTGPPLALPSNFGARIDCFGWGENVLTSGKENAGVLDHSGYDDFNGTSSAAAMIAGMAVLIQAFAVKKLRFRLGPSQMRLILSDPAHGTTVFGPGLSMVSEGTMPDLQKILNIYFGADLEDIFIRDNLLDNGNSPSTGPISNSPDIIVRNNRTSTNTSTNTSYYSTNRDLDDSENIATGGSGATAYIYVRAFNRGAAPANNVKVSLYYSRPGTLITPVNWTPIVTNSAFGTIPAKASITDPNGVQVVEITWNGIPADGHYCFIGLVGNENDPLIDPKDPQLVNFYSDFDNFRRFIRENNNATWKNFNVGPISGSMMMDFFVAGANDRPRPMGLEIVAGLPEGAQVWLQGRDEFLFALQGRRTPNLEHDAEKGLARIKVNPYGPYLFKDTIFPMDLHEPLQLIVDLPEEHRDQPYQLYARQLYEGEEVGRVTWQLTPPHLIPKGGVTPAEKRCIRLGRLWVALLALLVVVLGIHPLAGYLIEIIVGLGAALAGWAWYQACHPDNATLLKKLALGFGLGIVLLAWGVLAGLW